MTTIVENLSSQIDGVNVAFVTDSDLLLGVYITLNGLSLDSTDYTIIDSNNFTMAYPPSVNDELIVFFTPTVYDISDQITGTNRIFDRDVADVANTEFLAVLNGLVYNTTKVSDSQFDLGFYPEVGDVLEYMRGYFVIHEEGLDKSYFR